MTNPSREEIARIDGMTAADAVEHSLKGYLPKMSGATRRGIAEEVTRIAQAHAALSVPMEGGGSARVSLAAGAEDQRPTERVSHSPPASEIS